MDKLEITAELPHIGINSEDIPKVDLKKVRNNEEAFIMLLNSMKASSSAYEKANAENKELNNKIKELELKNSDRKLSVIIITVAEIITSIGVSGMFSEYATAFLFVVLAGMLMTVLALYINLKK